MQGERSRYEDEEEGSLTFQRFKQINEAKKLRWHAVYTREWIGPDWGNELAGEAGELCNVIKKFQRFRAGIEQADFNLPSTLANLKKEIGDVVICAELVAEFFNISLEESVRYAFNKTSEKNGFPERL